jgi:uncharacterized protein YjiS (DUF1127 family)
MKNRLDDGGPGRQAVGPAASIVRRWPANRRSTGWSWAGMLRGIGLTRFDAGYEINKPFWRE